jgi:hypothetical protein
MIGINWGRHVSAEHGKSLIVSGRSLPVIPQLWHKNRVNEIA